MPLDGSEHSFYCSLREIITRKRFFILNCPHFDSNLRISYYLFHINHGGQYQNEKAYDSSYNIAHLRYLRYDYFNFFLYTCLTPPFYDNNIIESPKILILLVNILGFDMKRKSQILGNYFFQTCISEYHNIIG